ncbi:MAG: AAA family ATPase [Ardenticatenales bacterium]|nr:AAA family ATPase [Ardenticatenales bacterium]
MANLNDRLPDNSFAPPPPLRRAVPRPALVARIEAALDGGLVLVSAPAGSGKTTALAEWAAASRRAVAWLAVGPRDHDPLQFATHLAAAVRPLAPGAVDAVLPTALRSAGSVGARASDAILPVAHALAGALFEAERSSVIVLDDVHELTDAAHWAGIEAFVAERPPAITLILAARSDPPLPLARWRLAGALAEVREADLRLDRDVLTAVVAKVAGVALTGAQAAVLEARTEGWAAGVQAAALALQGQPDVAAAVARFAGDHRFILDYLDAEVIDRQPPVVLAFLLDVAILDRMSPTLCDAVRAVPPGESASWLDRLVRQDLFLQPLDDAGGWYRFHRLFADRLRHRLERTAPDRAAVLHQRAAAWFAANDDFDEAIAHALQSDAALAADLIGQAAPGRLTGRQAATVLGWLRALPDGTLRADPRLMVAMAWALFAAESRATAEPWLGDAEAALASTGGAADDASPAAHAEALGAAAALRAQMASWDGDVDAALRHSAVALETLGPGSIWRADVALAVGAAHHLRGDVPAAIDTFRAAVVDAEAAGRAEAAIFARAMLAESLFLAGRLTDAATVADQALARAESVGGTGWPATARAGVVLGHIHLERNDLVAAAAAAEQTIAAGRRASTRVLTFTGLLLRADVRAATGDHAGAIEAVDEAAEVAKEPALLADLAQFRAELELDAGRPAAAIAP